ncbi:MAG: hypothetical protein EA390_13620 [Balneolaceae bacterium]|nr:MAG: hypothetical protein EA390_13620 [Balneolaceae bacterium]
MLIVVAGVLLSLGITQTSLFGGLGQMVGHSVNFTEKVQAKNIAYMGTELAIRKMIDEPDWRDGGTIQYPIEGGDASIRIEETVPEGFFRIYSTAIYNGHTQEVILLVQEVRNSKVPIFDSALSILFEKEGEFTGSISGGGNKGGIDGNDVSGECDPVPGVRVPGEKDKAYLKGIDDDKPSHDYFRGDPDVEASSDMDFDEIAELIAALKAANPTYLKTDGTNIRDLGSADNPGVFFVENGTAKIAGNTEGFGIMVVRGNHSYVEAETGEEIEVDDGALDISGNVKFNGLVIFENAYNLTSSGTVDIFGSVLVGKTQTGAIFDFLFNGNSTIQYDCSAQKYADMAAINIPGGGLTMQARSVFEK